MARAGARDAGDGARPVALLVTPVLPESSGSGRALRSWNWLQTLSSTHDVHILLVTEAAMPVTPTDYPAAAVWHVTGFLTQPPLVARVVGGVLPILVPWSRWYGLGWAHPAQSPALAGLVAQLAAADVDRIVVFRLYLHDVGLALARLFPAARLDLDLDDLEAATRLSLAFCALRLRRYRQAIFFIASAAQFGCMQRLAKGAYGTAYLAADTDVPKLRTTLARQVEHRPNRVALPVAPPDPPSGEVYRMLFVGSLGYLPNEEAARLLVTQILPALRHDNRRSWRLRIIGRGAPPALLALLHGNPAVEFFADSVDPAEHYALSHVALAPLFAGGGTKLKVIEAFGHRRPVVSTGEGVSGLLAVDGEHYVRAETSAQFAAAVATLASDPERARRLAEAGRRLCLENYALD